MTAIELLASCQEAGPQFQRHVNAFMDEFRRAGPASRKAMIREALPEEGELQGLIAAVVSALCREVGMPVPEWVAHTGSPRPFFAFPARSFPLRLRLMLETPPPFRTRNVFVPADYLSRA